MNDVRENTVSRIEHIAKTVLAAESAAINCEGAWPVNTIEALKEAKLMGLVVPKRYGGLGEGLLGLTQASNALGYYSGSAGLCYAMHCVGSAVIADKPTQEQVQRYLLPICEGKHVTTLAMSERKTGAHFYLPETSLQWDANDDLYHIQGEKCFVTNGGHADSYVISGCSVNENASAPFSCLLVCAQDSGLDWGESWCGFGMKGNQSRTVRLEAALPRERLLGEVGDQTHYLFHVVLPYFLSGMSGTYLGLVRRALDEVISHLGSRVYSHTAQVLSSTPILQHRLGVLWSRYRALHALSVEAATAFDQGKECAMNDIMCSKAEISEQGVSIVNACMTILGGRGYAESSIICDVLRDMRAASVMSPTSDLLYTWIGRVKLGLPILD